MIALPEIGLGCANMLQASLPEFIDAAERAGFRHITVRPLSFVQALEVGWTDEALRRRLAEAGVEVTMIDAHITALPGRPSSSDFGPELLARLPPDVIHPPAEDMCFRAARVLGASTVNVTHYMGSPVPREVLAEALAGVCQRAGLLGLRICLEFFPDSGLPDLPFAQSVVEACGEPNASVLLDVFHLDRSGGTVEDIRRLPPGLIAGVQISDRRRPHPDTPHLPFSGRLLPGQGELPLCEVVEAALQNSPAATLDIEVLNEDLRCLPADEVAARLASATASWRATFS